MSMNASGVLRRSCALVLVGLIAVVAAGCVEGPGFNPNARGIRVESPYPRTNLPDDVDVEVVLSGANWAPGREVVFDQCAFVEDVEPRCEQVGTVVTDVDGTFPLTTVYIRHMLSVDGIPVPCDTEVGDVTLPGFGTYHPRSCRLVVRYTDEAVPGALAAWFSFAGHVF